MFKAAESGMSMGGTLIRLGCITGCILGFYLLFAPVIALLSWIPLVGYLLGSLVNVAAFLFALVTGGTMACFVLCLAWLFFNPMIGVPLLLLTCLGIGLIFYP